VLPVETEDVYVDPHEAELQFDTYFFCTSEGALPPTVTEFEAPSVKVLPRVSVGVEGGPCPDHPSPSARTFPEATFEVNASPQLAELQFEAKFCWTFVGLPVTTFSELDAPRANVSPKVSVGVEGGF
jgi:hypothetical protein